MCAVGVVMVHRMGAEPLVETAMGALDQQVVVEAAEHGGEGVWVSQGPGAVLILGAQPVGEARGPVGQQALEEAVLGAVF